MHTPTGHLTWLILAAALVWPTAPPTAQGQRNAAELADVAYRPDFTRAEMRKLEAGELVVRRADERNRTSRLTGGTSWQLIEAPTGEVWEILIKLEHYRRILPEVSDVRMVENRKRERTLFIEHGSGPLSICYYVDMKFNSDRREVSFQVDPREQCAVEEGWGFYLLRPHGKDKTVLVYGIMVDIGEGIILSLLREEISEWMLKVPWMAKRLVESTRAKRHAAAARAPHR
jgi:carbon monoxide dehydrogenase subunit G